MHAGGSVNAALAAEIEARITGIIARLCPEAAGRSMYGGTMFETEPGIYKTGFCGVFCYTNHVSLEFGQGVKLVDTLGVLEGKGKLRRHIKLKSLEDLDRKAVETYLKQALAL